MNARSQKRFVVSSISGIVLAVCSLTYFANAQMPGVDPQASQLVTLLNNAIKSDMNPMFKQKSDQEFVEYVAKPMYQTMSFNYLQEAGARIKQLIDYHERQPGDDHHRAALSLYLATMPFSGMSAENVRVAFITISDMYVGKGENWPQRGNCGAMLNRMRNTSFASFGGGGFGGGGFGGGGFGGGGVSPGGSCQICHGTGTCTICHGTGSVRQYGVTVSCDRQCSACGGTGRR